MYQSAKNLSVKFKKGKTPLISYIKEKLDALNTSDCFSFTDNPCTLEAAENLISASNSASNSDLFGIMVALDDTIMTKDKPTTAGSYILNNFVPPFGATIIPKLINAGMIIAGKTKTDEFSIAPVFDNLPNESLGALNCIKEDLCSLSFSNDFSGKYRITAPSLGLFYIKPTYGTVSRFGLISSVASIDQIGVAGKNPDDIFAALKIISGHDNSDGVTYKNETYDYSCSDTDLKGLKIGLPVNIINKLDDKTKTALKDYSEKLSSLGATITEFDFNEELLNILPQVLYILSCAEISNSLNRFDGVKFGYRTPDFIALKDLYLKSRTEGLGLNAKLSSLMGCMVLSADNYEKYYNKAMKIRRLLKNYIDELFSSYDSIILPSIYNLTEPDFYKDTAFTSVASLTGIPGLAMPVSSDNIGAQLISDSFNENILFRISKTYNDTYRKED